MWNNGSSRRGRRMSIDLPSLHISGPGKDGFPGNPFFPGLPMALMNGKETQFSCKIFTKFLSREWTRESTP